MDENTLSSSQLNPDQMLRFINNSKGYTMKSAVASLRKSGRVTNDLLRQRLESPSPPALHVNFAEPNESL